ncbi:hypothetical protein H632_c1816p1 [Helicosporidium sp. ATCC 50920]|nr:hypothetical protein H632_c1816p1 [Helicosporidium sp. ATCC 50920]|eukprot:KDD73818.1 hypothetical protein H632_c1816p1 [Helicosporidium sp. ATCC 50920]
MSSEGEGQHGCSHYRRRAKLVTPCCDRVFWCRHCHNEEMNDAESDPRKRHILDRSQVKFVECGVCSARQPVSEVCSHCGVRFGAYTCTKCPFFSDDTSNDPFHCDQCGLCRVGGRDNFFHCERCGSCYSLALRDSHTCVERSMHQDCPICSEYLFESTSPASVLPCGHTLHSSCLKLLARSHQGVCPTCPICMRAISDESARWEHMDAVLAVSRMPAEYRGWTADVLCNDCAGSGVVPFHFMGLKCPACGSYNTRQAGLHKTEPREEEEDSEAEDRAPDNATLRTLFDDLSRPEVRQQWEEFLDATEAAFVAVGGRPTDSSEEGGDDSGEEHGDLADPLDETVRRPPSPPPT